MVGVRLCQASRASGQRPARSSASAESAASSGRGKDARDRASRSNDPYVSFIMIFDIVRVSFVYGGNSIFAIMIRVRRTARSWLNARKP